MKHTPGPWKIKHRPAFSVEDNKERHIAMVSCYKELPGDEEENLANAYLIASAPELLDRLIQAIKIIEVLNKPNHKLFIHKTRQAIAKAEGR